MKSKELFTNYQQMQHLKTKSLWDYQALMDQVSHKLCRSLPEKKLMNLHINEYNRENKRDKNVAVISGYCGKMYQKK